MKNEDVDVLLFSMPHFGVLKYACVLYHLGLVLYPEFKIKVVFILLGIRVVFKKSGYV